ncbi:hypothetical protein OQA88_10683 [Cercophora sp. LCS_1]
MLLLRAARPDRPAARRIQQQLISGVSEKSICHSSGPLRRVIDDTSPQKGRHIQAIVALVLVYFEGSIWQPPYLSTIVEAMVGTAQDIVDVGWFFRYCDVFGKWTGSPSLREYTGEEIEAAASCVAMVVWETKPALAFPGKSQENIVSSVGPAGKSPFMSTGAVSFIGQANLVSRTRHPRVERRDMVDMTRTTYDGYPADWWVYSLVTVTPRHQAATKKIWGKDASTRAQRLAMAAQLRELGETYDLALDLLILDTYDLALDLLILDVVSCEVNQGAGNAAVQAKKAAEEQGKKAAATQRTEKNTLSPERIGMKNESPKATLKAKTTGKGSRML